jgi:fido (protein-threonine AMPylation protein)
MFKPPMVSPLTWKNAFSQPSLLRFLDTQFRRQEQPLWPITLPNRKLPVPKQLQRFLGMVNFYHSFLPNYAEVQKTLPDLLREGAKILQWTTTTQEAFQQAKRLLAAAVPLQHPGPTRH